MPENVTGPISLPDITQGQPVRLRIRRLAANGTPTNFTGAQVAAHIRRDWNQPKVGQFSIDLYEAAQGWLALSLSASDTLAITPGDYKWDVRFVLSNGETDVLATGTITIEGVQTRNV